MVLTAQASMTVLERRHMSLAEDGIKVFAEWWKRKKDSLGLLYMFMETRGGGNYTGVFGGQVRVHQGGAEDVHR